MNSNHEYPVNIGNPLEISMLELAKKVCKIVDTDIQVVHSLLPKDDPVKRCPDITLAKKILGWKPKVNILEGLERTTEWFRECLK